MQNIITVSISFVEIFADLNGIQAFEKDAEGKIMNSYTIK
jgi:hypothetical protein